MGMLKTITAVVTSVDILTPVEIAATPHLPGRKVICELSAAPLTSVFKLQGAPRDPGTKDVPAEDSSTWADIASFSSSSALTQELALADYVRINVTTADADGPDVILNLKGVQ